MMATPPLPTAPRDHIKTRILIVSDTHGMEFSSVDKPLQVADVAIHCGDLTNESKLSEFRTAIRLLKDLNAPLKLVIAGNHDFTMDTPAFEKMVSDSPTPPPPTLLAREYGAHGDARRLFDEVADAGIIFLDEGNHRFTLQNGALLKVYATPMTPAFGVWGFQYPREIGHKFAIHEADVVVSHGPPKGIMDYTHERERAGCSDLFAAFARARPQIHCFGHIHEGWGAKLVTWRKEDFGGNPTHFTAIDVEKSFVVEDLARLKRARGDTPEAVEARVRKLELYDRERCCKTSHCAGDCNPMVVGAQTLFVNASAMGDDYLLVQKPWLVDIELPRDGLELRRRRRRWGEVIVRKGRIFRVWVKELGCAPRFCNSVNIGD